LRVLLDTHAFLWWLADHTNLSHRARRAIVDEADDVFVSAASVWEIATKRRMGKLDLVPFPNGIDVEIETEHFYALPVTAAHAERAGAFTHPHKDPFDRMLIAQALVEGLVLISNEALFDGFGVPRLW
jgi:PIN domain nuclease of toxin-antitoxin system